MAASPLRIAVTGATGFLGGHLLSRLEGHEVVAVVRTSSRTEAIEAAGHEIRRVAFDDPHRVREALSSVDVVVHAAGGGKVVSWEELRAQNAGLTETLLTAATAAGVRRFVLVSSLAAAGPSEAEPRQESDRPAPVSQYGKAKLEAETIARTFEDRLQIVVARPPSIYGPNDTRFLPLYRAAERGIAILPPTERMSIVYGPDCAEALALMCVAERIESGDTFFVTHPAPTTFKEIAEYAARLQGRERVRALKLFPALMKSAAFLLETYGRLTGTATPFGTDKARDGSQKYWLCTSDRIRDRLGWQAKTSLEDGLRATLTASSPPSA